MFPSSRQVELQLHRSPRVQFLPKSQEDIRYPGGDRQQTMHARVTRGAKGDHELRILDTGSVVNDNPVPAAANPAGMPIPLKDVLPVPSEVLLGSATAGCSRVGTNRPSERDGRIRKTVRTATKPEQAYGNIIRQGEEKGKGPRFRLDARKEGASLLFGYDFNSLLKLHNME